MKKLLSGLVLSIALTTAPYSYAGVLYEPIITEQAMHDKFEAEMQKFMYKMNSYLRCNQKYEKQITELDVLRAQLEIIYKYDITVGGSREAQDNFDKWAAELAIKHDKLLKDINQCYLNDSGGTIAQ